MFARKLVLTSCLAIAASMLAGCASYKNESGLPKWLDDASEANRLGYFMGISLKDSPAPEGFDPSKNTLVSDLTFSTLAHSNALPGIDIGSFGVELGLSLATNILNREEEEDSQANVYFPAEQFATHEEAYKAALAAMGEKLAKALKANGYSIYKTVELSTFGNRYLQLRVEKESVGCRQTKSILDGCAFNVKFDPDDGADEPVEIPSYLGFRFARGWDIPRIKFPYHAKSGINLEKEIQPILQHLSKNLPPNTLFYLAPMKQDEHWTAPYISDGKNAYFFVKRKGQH